MYLFSDLSNPRDMLVLLYQLVCHWLKHKFLQHVDQKTVAERSYEEIKPDICRYQMNE